MGAIALESPREGTRTNLEELVPPPELNFVGTGDFLAIGNEFLRHFIKLGALKPHERVLDVGCGIGRMTVALTQYLDEQGSYEGFDIVPSGIDWCRRKIEPRFPRFHFQLADIYNKHYLPKGQVRASEFRFPYANDSFDFVFLTSIFTHILPADMENYVYEIARVLKPSGRCLMTFFLLNSESLELIASHRSTLDFQHQLTPFCRVARPEVPEETIGYDEKYVVDLLSRYGLDLNQPIQYGIWCARPRHLSYQDVLVVCKNRKLSLAQRMTRTWSRWIRRNKSSERAAAHSAGAS
jgi:SAM-dependent methyltransferase